MWIITTSFAGLGRQQASLQHLDVAMQKAQAATSSLQRERDNRISTILEQIASTKRLLLQDLDHLAQVLWRRYVGSLRRLYKPCVDVADEIEPTSSEVVACPRAIQRAIQ